MRVTRRAGANPKNSPKQAALRAGDLHDEREKHANEFEIAIQEEARSVAIVVNTAVVGSVFPFLIKMAAVELARRDNETKR